MKFKFKVSWEILNMIKRKTIRKWELNTSINFVKLRAEDFFVDQCLNKI